MTDPQGDAQTEALFRSRPDLTDVQLAQPDGGFIDAGAILRDLHRRMMSVIDHFAHGFGLEDYLPQDDVEKMIMGGAERPLVAAAARYGAGLVHSRYGSMDSAWEPLDGIEITDYLDNLSPDGIAAGSTTFEAELTHQGERDPDPFAYVPEDLGSPADIVSAYTTVLFGFAVKIGELERQLLDGAAPPRSDRPTAAGWIAQDVYSLIAGRVHQVRASAYDTLEPWIDEFPDRDHVATAEAVISWARDEVGTAMGSTDVVLMMEDGPDVQRQKAAARYLAGALEIKLAEVFDRVGQAVHGASFAEECQSQNEAIGWTWQLIDTGVVTYLDEYRVGLCRAWVNDDALAAEQHGQK